MLVLTRKQNEAITIGKDIKVTVIKIDKGKVRIGITAPDDVDVSRDELQRHKPGKRNNYLML